MAFLRGSVPSDQQIILTCDSSLISGDVPYFVLLLKIDGTTEPLFSDMFTDLGANKEKLAIWTSDDTQCYVEVDHWDHVNEEAFLRVRINSYPSASDLILILYYDSTQDDNWFVDVVGGAQAALLWSNSYYEWRYSMGQDPSGGANSILDSRGDEDGTPAGSMTSGDLVDTPTGKGIQFDGVDDRILQDYFSPAAGGYGTGFAVELFIKFDDVTTGAGVWMMHEQGDPDANAPYYTNGYYWLWIENGVLSFGDSFVSDTVSGIVADTWYHIVYVHHDEPDPGNENIELWIDGVLRKSVTPSWGTSSIWPPILGVAYNSSYCFAGTIAEVIVHNRAPDEDKIKLSNASLRDNLITVSPPDAEGTGDFSMDQAQFEASGMVTVTAESAFAVSPVIESVAWGEVTGTVSYAIQPDINSYSYPITEGECNLSIDVIMQSEAMVSIIGTVEYEIRKPQYECATLDGGYASFQLGDVVISSAGLVSKVGSINYRVLRPQMEATGLVGILGTMDYDFPAVRVRMNSANLGQMAFTVPAVVLRCQGTVAPFVSGSMNYVVRAPRFKARGTVDADHILSYTRRLYSLADPSTTGTSSDTELAYSRE